MYYFIASLSFLRQLGNIAAKKSPYNQFFVMFSNVSELEKMFWVCNENVSQFVVKHFCFLPKFHVSATMFTSLACRALGNPLLPTYVLPWAYGTGGLGGCSPPNRVRNCPIRARPWRKFLR